MFVLWRWDFRNCKKCRYCWERSGESNISSKKSQEDTVKESVANVVEHTENTFASFITWTNFNRTWRGKYLCRSWLLIWIWVMCVFIVWVMFNDNAEGIFLIWMINILWAIVRIVASGLYLYWSILLRNKRLHDYWWSWWWKLLIYVPVSRFVLYAYMFFKPWNVWKKLVWKINLN